MPSYGFLSVANAVVLEELNNFADINPFTLNISYEDIRKKISKRTKAIYVIHYAGNPCEIEKISTLAKKNKIYLIEDSAPLF